MRGRSAKRGPLPRLVTSIAGRVQFHPIYFQAWCGVDTILEQREASSHSLFTSRISSQLPLVVHVVLPSRGEGASITTSEGWSLDLGQSQAQVQAEHPPYDQDRKKSVTVGTFSARKACPSTPTECPTQSFIAGHRQGDYLYALRCLHSTAAIHPLKSSPE
jgi:hypothetical protein